MELERKQLRRINGCAQTINISIVGITIAMTILHILTDFDVPSVIRLIIAIADVVINVILGKAWRYDSKYRHVCCITTAIVFFTVLATAASAYVYVFVFPVAILVLLFQDMFLIYCGVVLGIVSVSVFSIYQAIIGNNDTSETIYAIVMTVAVCLLALKITKIQIKNTKDAVDLAKSQALAQVEVSSSIVSLAEALSGKFADAKEVSDHLNESMESNHLAVAEIAESSRVTAEAITRQTEQTSGIQEDIRAVGDEASHMGELSENTNASVAQGVEFIQRLEAQATEVAKINNETKEITQQLNDSIKDVEAITATILGVSSQTNLLALNASIEAARAGEAGKGFAVVADEIRKLAEETRISTERIGEIIDRLTADAESASTSMTRSAAYAEKQNELIAETGGKLSEIKINTDSLYSGVMQINTTDDNIYAANQHIMESITDLSATSEEVAASTDTALSLSDDTMDALTSMNGLLEEINAIAVQMEQVASAE